MQESPPKSPNPTLLIDESLAAGPIAQILRSLDYNAIATPDQFGQGAEDETAIQWLGLQGGIWVTADEKAKREHSQAIIDAGIHILWIHRKKEGMSKKAQLLLLLWVLDPILAELARAKAPAQFRASYSGERPKWERL